jgi:hypothetical protein
MTEKAGQNERRRGSSERARSQNVSLVPRDWRALRLLAGEERHGNISAAVARMIDTAMTDRYGDDWRRQAPLGQVSSDGMATVA